jgi:hypothetical protein
LRIHSSIWVQAEEEEEEKEEEEEELYITIKNFKAIKKKKLITEHFNNKRTLHALDSLYVIIVMKGNEHFFSFLLYR